MEIATYVLEIYNIRITTENLTLRV